jgi:hypothetical protein
MQELDRHIRQGSVARAMRHHRGVPSSKSVAGLTVALQKRAVMYPIRMQYLATLVLSTRTRFLLL